MLVTVRGKTPARLEVSGSAWVVMTQAQTPTKGCDPPSFRMACFVRDGQACFCWIPVFV